MGDAFETIDDEARERLVPEELPRVPLPMLATLSRDHRDRPGWVHERKFDGQRVLLAIESGRARLVSRRGESLDVTYPELVAAGQSLDVPDVLVDGEVVAFDGDATSFARLQQRMGLRDAAKVRRSTVEVHLHLFDLLHLDGRSTRRLPLVDRRRLLDATVAFADPLRRTEQRTGDARGALTAACADGWEGLIAKDLASPYVGGRSRAWLKLKCSRRQALVIGGYTPSRGSRTGFGALLVGYHEHGRLRYAGKVGTGFDRRTLDILGEHLASRRQDRSPFADPVPEKLARFVPPELVCEVTFSEWTRDGRLRHPSFVGLRTDTEVDEVVRESGP